MIMDGGEVATSGVHDRATRNACIRGLKLSGDFPRLIGRARCRGIIAGNPCRRHFADPQALGGFSSLGA